MGLRSSLAGMIASFPVSLMSSPRSSRSLHGIHGGDPENCRFRQDLRIVRPSVQIMMINVGAGTLLVAVGATPVSILPLSSWPSATRLTSPWLCLPWGSMRCAPSPPRGAACRLLGSHGHAPGAVAQVFANSSRDLDPHRFGMLWIVGGIRQMKEDLSLCTRRAPTGHRRGRGLHRDRGCPDGSHCRFLHDDGHAALSEVPGPSDRRPLAPHGRGSPRRAADVASHGSLRVDHPYRGLLRITSTRPGSTSSSSRWTWASR